MPYRENAQDETKELAAYVVGKTFVERVRARLCRV